MKDLLARPAFRRLLIGQAVSGLGDWMATFALMVLVLDLTGSAAAVGGVLVLRLLPGLVAAPIAARAGRRYGRRRVMLAMDLVRAGVALLLPLGGWLWWVYGWAFVLEVASLVFLPARDAAVPALAGPPRTEERLGRANALVLASSYGGIPLGAGLFGLVFWASAPFVGGRGPYVVVFTLDALSFLVSYAAIRRIPAGDAEDGPDSGVARPGDGFFAGLRLPLIRAVLPGMVCVMAGIGALFSVGVSYVQEVLGAGPVQFGVLIACFGAGACAALGGRPLLREVPLFTQLRLATLAQGVIVAVMSLTDLLLLGLLGAFLYGLTGTTALIAGTSLLQDRLTGRARDLAFTAVHITARVGLAVAALVAGAAADLARPQHVLAGAGVIVVLGALIIRKAEVGDAERAGTGADGHDGGAAGGPGEPMGHHPRTADPDRGRPPVP